MSVLIFSTTFVWKISHSKKRWARYDQKCILFFTYSTRYSCPVLMKLEIINSFSKNTQISNSMKILPVETELFHTDRRRDGRTYRTELIVAFRNFSKAPKNLQITNTFPAVLPTNQLHKKRSVIRRCSTRHRGFKLQFYRSFLTLFVTC